MIYTVTLNPSIDYTVHVADLNLGELNKIDTEFTFPGGKGINVSRILTRLTTANTALGFLGGFTGKFVEQSLSDEGISHDFTTVAQDTRINIKLKAQEETEINGQGPLVTPTEQADLKAKLATIMPGDTVIFSGSMPPCLTSSFYNDLIQIVIKKQGNFIIDTTGDQLLNALPYGPLLIKPNQHELAEMFKVELTTIADIIPYGQRLRQLGAQNVLVSLGKDGALLFCEDGVFQAPPLQGQLKNSVGAGDSMIAGFTSQLVKKPTDLVTAFRYGVAAGSGTAFSDDLASSETILQLEKQVEIDKLDV